MKIDWSSGENARDENIGFWERFKPALACCNEVFFCSNSFVFFGVCQLMLTFLNIIFFSDELNRICMQCYGQKKWKL